MAMRQYVRLSALVALGTIAAPHAAAQVFTTEAAFTAALDAGSYFNTLAGTSGTSFSGGSAPFGYTVSAPGGIYNGPSLIGTNSPNVSFTFTLNTGSPNAFGANFYSTNISDAFRPGVPISLTYSDGFIDAFTPASASAFRGYIAAVPLTSLILGVPVFDGDNNNYASISNGRVGVAAVPEPTSMALAAVGLGGFAAFRRKTRRAV